ncbi:MAG: ribonuclease HI [Chitinophagales bacterium]|nr:ribonuclease HI [Chitinophagales bacterium]
MINIYTDGASRGNPGKGGYGIILQHNKHYKELSAGYRLTTNNRMELLACIVALEALKKPNLTISIYTDSKYVVDSINLKWVFAWIKKADFAKKKNKDLWLRFLAVYKQHQVTMVWIKGHNQHPQNERCDELATQAADGDNLLIDEAYENQLN